MRLVRWLFPGAIWLVTNRTEQEQFLLLPSEKLNELIGAWLARALEKYGDGIDLYGFIFLSNHFHLLLRDTKGQLARFMWYFQTNLAKAVNKELGRRGRVFGRRYDAELVDGDEAFLASYSYILGNAVKAGLVSRAVDWPGLSSLRAVLEGRRLLFASFDQTAYHNATRREQKVDKARFFTGHEILLAKPPMWSGLTREEVSTRTADLVRGFEERQRSLRAGEGKGFLGKKDVMRRRVTDRPAQIARRARSMVLSRDGDREKDLEGAWRAQAGAYRERFERFRRASRSGRSSNNTWPPWTCPPCTAEPVGYDAVA